MFPAELLRGSQDTLYKFSEKNQSFVISQAIPDFYFFGGLQNTFQIYSGGYVLFGGNDFYFRDTPLSSASQWAFSYVAPFWTQTKFNPDAYVVYGQYTDRSVETQLFNSVETKINAQIDTVYLISWINLMPSTSSATARATTTGSEVISYQVVFGYNSNTQKTYMYFNYQSVANTDFPAEQVVLIGYQTSFENGNPPFVYTNPLSNSFTGAATTKPFTFLNTNGLTFDVSYQGTDKCLLWANSAATKAIKTALTAQLSSNKFVSCPCTATQASLNRKFKSTSLGGPLCYVPRTQYGKATRARQVNLLYTMILFFVKYLF